jgi:predicted DNA-binding protein (UPF0251 family)
MPRPRIPKWVGCEPGANFFKPRGIPLSALEKVTLTMEEFEALRLSDYEGLYQEDGAKEMNVSRQTFARILESAHKKTAEVLLFGKALMIQGGDFIMVDRVFECPECGYRWLVPHGAPRPTECPSCKGPVTQRATREPGHGRCGRRCRFRGGTPTPR